MNSDILELAKKNKAILIIEKDYFKCQQGEIHFESSSDLEAFADAIRKEQAAKIAMLHEFARECANNWDCDSDAHKYGTLCRACEAKKALSATEADAAKFIAEIEANALNSLADEVMETVSHDDAADHSFENGKEAVAKWAKILAAQKRGEK